MLKRLWAEHRNACLLSLALLVVGAVVNPWLFLAAVLPISWVLLNKKPAQEDQPLTVTEEPETMSELPKEWVGLNQSGNENPQIDYMKNNKDVLRTA